MRRAERKLRLSHNVVGDDVVDREVKERTAVETNDLRSIIFGLHLFDPKAINNEESDDLRLSGLNSMVEKVIAMRHEQVSGKAGRKFEVNPVALLEESDLFMHESFASATSYPDLDEASYRSWVEKFKEASESSSNTIAESGSRRSPEDKQRKLEAASRKAEEKKLAKWEANGYQSLSVKTPICSSGGDMMSDSGSVQFVYGDCTHPFRVCPSEPAVILRLSFYWNFAILSFLIVVLGSFEAPCWLMLFPVFFPVKRNNFIFCISHFYVYPSLMLHSFPT